MITRAALCAALLLPWGASAQPATSSDPPVLLGIRTNGGVTWNGLSLSHAAFEKQLAEAAKLSPELEVRILPNKHVAYKQVAHLLTVLQRYNVKIGLIGNEQAP